MDIKEFWRAVLRQNADTIRQYINPDAYVNWHCTNEHFTVEEFIRANCEYPSERDGEVEKIVTTDDMIITATRVYPKDRSAKGGVRTSDKFFIFAARFPRASFSACDR